MHFVGIVMLHNEHGTIVFVCWPLASRAFPSPHPGPVIVKSTCVSVKVYVRAIGTSAAGMDVDSSK